jgi:molecular chaperone DnaK (HSP70)
MTFYCGVDFGTSNSTVAAIGKDGPLLIPLEDLYTTIPTVLFFRTTTTRSLWPSRHRRVRRRRGDGKCAPSKASSAPS